MIASNSALDEFLGGLPVELRFRARDAESLADTLLAFAAAGPRRRARTREQSCAGASSPVTPSNRGRMRSRRSLPPRPASNIIAVAIQPSEPALPSRDRDVRAARPYVLSRAPVADVRAPRARDHVSCAARHHRAVARSLHRARPAQRRLRRSRPLEPPLAHGVRGVAAVPHSDHPARLLAGGAVRHAGAPRRSRAGRVVTAARRADRPRLRVRNRLRLQHDRV